MTAAITQATAVATSFEDTDLDSEARGMLSDAVFPGKVANADGTGGGGGEENEGKKGVLTGAGVENGMSGVVGAGGEGTGGVESTGKNGWWRTRRLRTATAAAEEEEDTV